VLVNEVPDANGQEIQSLLLFTFGWAYR